MISYYVKDSLIEAILTGKTSEIERKYDRKHANNFKSEYLLDENGQPTDRMAIFYICNTFSFDSGKRRSYYMICTLSVREKETEEKVYVLHVKKVKDLNGNVILGDEDPHKLSDGEFINWYFAKPENKKKLSVLSALKDLAEYDPDDTAIVAVVDAFLDYLSKDKNRYYGKRLKTAHDKIIAKYRTEHHRKEEL